MAEEVKPEVNGNGGVEDVQGVAEKSEVKATASAGEKPNPQEEILKHLKKESWSVPGIAGHFETSEEEAVKLIDSLIRKGYDINIDRSTKRVSLVLDPVTLEPLKIDPEKIQNRAPVYRYTFKILFWDSSVFGSKHSQTKLMHTLYAYAEREGVDFAVGSGVTAGIMNKRRQGEVFLHGAWNQRAYALRHIPEARFKTYLVSGKRDLSHKTRFNPAYNIVRDICLDQSRSDLIYRGDLSAVFHVKDVRIEVINPGEDFAPYAKSFPLQRIMENMYGEEYGHTKRDEKVVLALFGSHMFDDQPDYMIARGFLVPTLQAMTPYQKSRRRRGFAPVLGGVILHLSFDESWHLKENGMIVEPVILTRYQRTNDYLVEARLKDSLTKEQSSVVELLAERPRTEGDISRTLKINKDQVWEIVKALKELKYKILTPDDPEQADTRQFALKLQPKKSFAPIALGKVFSKKVTVGFTSDKHYGNMDAQPSCVALAYKDAEEAKIDVMCDTGDLTGGLVDHPSNKFKVFIPPIEGQMLFAADHHPKPKFKQYLIAGDHDMFAASRVGIDPVRRIFAKERLDITYLGPLKGNLEVKGLKIRLMHPGGGPGYALSYQAQKRIESEIKRMISRGSKEKYHVLALGNWHVANWQFNVGVAVIVVPCFQEQTTDYMMRKGLDPWIGMWIMEFTLDSEGFVSSVKAKYYNYAPYTKALDLPDMNIQEFFERYMFPNMMSGDGNKSAKD